MQQDSDALIATFFETLPAHPGDTASMLATIEQTFNALADLEYQQGVRRTVPGATAVYGVRVPHLRALGSGLAKRYRGNADDLRALALAIWQANSREHQVLALVTLGKAKLSAEEAWQLSLTLLPDINNWETCDQMCLSLLGEALVKHTAYMDTLETWLDHPNFWQRRAALVATTLLRRFKGSPDEARMLDERALAMCLFLLEDPEPYIMKAVDWVVREVIKRHPDLGAAWMFERAGENLSRKAQSTLKKAAKKLTADEQAYFLELLNS